MRVVRVGLSSCIDRHRDGGDYTAEPAFAVHADRIIRSHCPVRNETLVKKHKHNQPIPPMQTNKRTNKKRHSDRDSNRAGRRAARAGQAVGVCRRLDLHGVSRLDRLIVDVSQRSEICRRRIPVREVNLLQRAFDRTVRNRAERIVFP